MDILAIIPARIGSKGIPMKNISKFARKPLILYTISAAKKSKLISKIIVSTDSKKIADISKKSGVEVPFLRPKKLSRDSSSTLDVVKHTLNFLSKNNSYIPDVIVVLQPTSPLRTSKLIDKSIQLLTKSKASSVISVSEVITHPYMSFWEKSGFLIPFRKDFQKYTRRQTLPSLLCPNGAIYTFWNKTIKKYDSFYGPKIKPLIVNDIQKFDIDTPLDFFITEMIFKNWRNYTIK